MMSNAVKLGYITIVGVGKVYIGEYDPTTLTTRARVNGKFVNLAWNGSSWVEVKKAS